MATQSKQGDERAQRGGEEKPLPVARRLPMPVRQRIVVLLAQFHTLKQVHDIILDEYGYDIGPTTLAHYDPQRSGGKPSRRLATLYHAARERHLNDLTTIGVAHQAHRLRTLDRVAQASERKGEYGTVMACLKQAAEEMGGVLTNVRRHQHSGAVASVHMSLEDAKAALAERLASVIDETPALPAPFPSLTEDTDKG